MQPFKATAPDFWMLANLRRNSDDPDMRATALKGLIELALAAPGVLGNSVRKHLLSVENIDVQPGALPNTETAP